MTYICGKCKAEISTLFEGMVRCPSCGHRILYKTRDSIMKEQKAD